MSPGKIILSVQLWAVHLYENIGILNGFSSSSVTYMELDTPFQFSHTRL
jgi:hypothetical protein